MFKFGVNEKLRIHAIDLNSSNFTRNIPKTERTETKLKQISTVVSGGEFKIVGISM